MAAEGTWQESTSFCENFKVERGTRRHDSTVRCRSRRIFHEDEDKRLSDPD